MGHRTGNKSADNIPCLHSNHHMLLGAHERHTPTQVTGVTHRCHSGGATPGVLGQVEAHDPHIPGPPPRLHHWHPARVQHNSKPVMQLRSNLPI
jgi:hypothetical protein